jgi:hypothetical protein
VAATYDGTTMTLYVNGQPQTTFAVSGSIPTTSNPLVIAGKYNSTATND